MSAGRLCDYRTGAVIRHASAAERRASIDAAKRDRGRGVIDVDGRRCYVDGPPGRPPLDPLAVRSVTIRLRVQPDEADVFREAAERDGVKLSEWLRDLALAAALRSGGG